MNEKRLPTLLTIPEFSAALKVSRACTRRWIFEQKIESVRCGRLVRILETEVARIIREGLRPRREATN
jgi:excisionase family DNA binding protein